MIGIVLTIVLSAQVPTPEPRHMVLHLGTETTRTERDLQIEYQALRRVKNLTRGQHARMTAVISTLGSIPGRCTDSQAAAGLCQQARCITWEQHVAEVTSWWAAPERRYVACSDPRVRPPN